MGMRQAEAEQRAYEAEVRRLKAVEEEEREYQRKIKAAAEAAKVRAPTALQLQLQPRSVSLYDDVYVRRAAKSCFDSSKLATSTSRSKRGFETKSSTTNGTFLCSRWVVLGVGFASNAVADFGNHGDLLWH